jgi:hypothetical protein
MSAAVTSCRASFRSLGTHLVNHHVHPHVRIHAEREGRAVL